MGKRDNETWVTELKGKRGRYMLEIAFQDLGDALLPPIRWYLSQHLANSPNLDNGSYQELDQLAQDIAQESLVKIWRRGLNSYAWKASFLTYAKVIALNQARQELRQMRRRRIERWPSSNDDETDREDDEKLSIDELVVTELPIEKRVMLQEAIQCIDHILAKRCPPREREAFLKKYRDGLKSKEIAQLMGTTERAVNLLTFSARERLRDGLEEEGYTLTTLLDILNG